MKSIVFTIAFALLLSIAYSQTTLWDDIKALPGLGSDAAVLNVLGLVYDRAVGRARADACMNHYFNDPGILPNSTQRKERFLAFLCTAFGGNPSGTPSSEPGCQYTNLAGTTTYFSDDLANVLALYQTFHTRMNISAPEQTYFKGVIAKAATGFGVLPTNILTAIVGVLDATDNFTINPAATPRDCATITKTIINWRVGTVNLRSSANYGDITCFNWTDGQSHTVRLTNKPAGSLTDFVGYGGGDVNNATAISACGGTPGPCSYFTGDAAVSEFCHTWIQAFGDNSGNYDFDCAIHGSTSMSATISVAVSASPSASAVATPSSSSASGLLSFLSWF